MADSEAEAMIGHLPGAGKLAGGAIRVTVPLSPRILHRKNKWCQTLISWLETRQEISV